jgi:hypothetical protein
MLSEVGLQDFVADMVISRMMRICDMTLSARAVPSVTRRHNLLTLAKPTLSASHDDSFRTTTGHFSNNSHSMRQLGAPHEKSVTTRTHREQAAQSRAPLLD